LPSGASTVAERAKITEIFARVLLRSNAAVDEAMVRLPDGGQSA
jgi:hypothetical protein